MTIFGTTVGGLVGAGAALHAEVPDRVPWSDVALLAVATHKVSRVITKDAITSPLRAPFTRFEGPAGPGELNEDVVATSTLGHSTGELLTCPLCLAVWVATGFTFGYVVAPRPTRLLAAGFNVVAGSDFLQFAYAFAEQHTH
jgi:hypothetical protein